VALLAGTPAVKTAAQLRGPEVVGVHFVGNETFPSDSLAGAIATRETDCRAWVFQLTLLCPLNVDFAKSRSQLRERDLPRDRARLVLWYRQRGFRDVQVDPPTVQRGGATAEVTFVLREGRPVIADSIAFVGAGSFADDGLLEDLPIRAGARMSTFRMEATRDSIIRRLSNRGYAYAEVYRNALRPAEDPFNAIVTFEIVPGPETRYGEISVAGAENLSVRTVLRTTQLRSGEPYRQQDVVDAATRLYGLEIVRSASVVPDLSSEVQDSVVDVSVTIQEGDAYRVRAGGGWSTAECLNLEARWASRNFFGGGRLLQVRGRVGNLLATDFRDILCRQSGQGRYARLTGTGTVDFVQPWIFSTRNSLAASVFVERQSLPDIFIRRAVGAQLALSRTLSPGTRVVGFYRPELSELEADDVLFCTGFLVCSPDDLRRLQGANRLAPVGLTMTRDRSDDLLNPRQGYRVLADFEHAAPWTLSEFRYDRAVVEASRYVPVGRAVFAGRVRGGWVGAGGFEGAISTPDSLQLVHPQKRFYTGGANSVRGFAQSRLGPRVLVVESGALLSSLAGGGACAPQELQEGSRSCVPRDGVRYDPRPTGGTRVFEANAEIRFMLWSLFEGVVFTDAGQAWGPDQGIRAEDLEFTPGVGVRFPSPVGPIRVDLAYRFTGPEELSVITPVLRPYDATRDQAGDRILVDGVSIDWVSTGTLDALSQRVLFAGSGKGLQLHVSIGQAF
jgi:outer membrane protein assembly factor BamA